MIKLIYKYLFTILTEVIVFILLTIILPCPIFAPKAAIPKLPIILLDPGHGGYDGGTHDHQGLLEKNIVLTFGFLLKDELEKYHFSVYLTRATDRELSEFAPYQGTRQGTDLLARSMMIDKYQANILISLHINAATNLNLCGGIVFYQRKSASSKELASLIQEYIKKVQPYNRQTILPGNFYLLNKPTIPSVLVELAFITNAHEHDLLKKTEFLESLASQIAYAIYLYSSK